MHQADTLSESTPSLSDRLRGWRRRLKARLPYVRRREHRILQEKYAALIESVSGMAQPAAQARLQVAEPMRELPPDSEVCLFVSFAPEPTLKPHVVAHIEHLLAAGIRVVLILNTGLPPADMRVDAGFTARLSGLLIRENTGFDFGAWAHALSLCPDPATWRRLWLVNDSIVGPLNAAHFAALVANIRSADADVVGLTEALSPTPHLQSYFLVFNASALASGVPQDIFRRVLNLPSKTQVVDVYETRLTARLEARGLRCVALFPTRTHRHAEIDDTSRHWAQLLQRGFPYVKTRVLDRLPARQRPAVAPTTEQP